MKKLFIASLILMICIILSAQAPEWIGAKRAGGTGDDRGQAIALDSQGNQYVTGLFQGAAVFGTTDLTSSGDYDIFVAKLDSEGSWLWARRAGGTGQDASWDIAVDGAGNSYITGRFAGTADFGPTTLQNTIDICTFVAKLDTDGNWLWAQQTGAHDDDNEAESIALDSQSNIYVAGCFWVSVHFGTIPFTANGMGDIFIAKLDTDGHWLSATQYGGAGWDAAISVCVDAADHVYATGYFNQTVAFGATSLSSNGGDDIFVLEEDNSGALQWAKQAGGSNADFAWDIHVDSEANVFTAGSFIGTASFGIYQLISAGGKDIWIAKLDTNGNWLWVHRAGGTGEDVAYGLAIDSSDDLYVTGYFQNEVVFGATTLTANGGIDIFVAKEDNAGDWMWLWAKQAGGTDNDFGGALALDSAGNAILTGGFQSTIHFGPSELTSSGNWDTYVAKLGPSTGIDDDTAPEISTLSVLHDAYPNPFRSGNSTTIKTTINTDETGTLSIYNLKGQIIATYNLYPGTHETAFDGSGLASGVYLYRLKTPSVHTVKKLVLLK
jgi:hypothetical protein